MALIYDAIERELKQLARARSLAKKSEERLATLLKQLRAQGGGHERYLPEPGVSNDVGANEEMLALVRKGLQKAGYVPKLKR